MERYLSFGLRLIDPAVPWPARGSAETDLTPREGWTLQTIVTPTRDGPTTVQAMTRGCLAVHRMLGGDEGFATSLAGTGLRISWDGAVWARSADAMAFAEAMMAAREDWPLIELHGWNAGQRKVFGEAMEAATLRGEIMGDRVYPS